MRFSSIVTGFLKHKDAYFKYHRFWVHDAIVHTFYHPSGKRAIKSEIQLHLMTGNKEIPAWLWLQVRKSVYEGPLKSPHILRNVKWKPIRCVRPCEFPSCSTITHPLGGRVASLTTFWSTLLHQLPADWAAISATKQTKTLFCFPDILLFLFSFFFPSLLEHRQSYICVSHLCGHVLLAEGFFFFSHKRPDKEYVLPRPGL